LSFLFTPFVNVILIPPKAPKEELDKVVRV